MFFKSIKLAAAMVLGLGAASANAATFVYDLFDHPDAQRAADYGLRLDAYNKFFSFEHNGASATLVYDDVLQKVRIEGTMAEYTGGGSYGALWAVKYTMTNVTNIGVGFFEDLFGAGVGNISDGATTLALGAKANLANPPQYFWLDANGHRIDGDDTTIVGHGWVDPDLPDTGKFNDFLFTAQIDPGGSPGTIPLPAAAWMLLSGVAGLGVMSRRRRG